MFFSLLLVTFLISLAVCFIVARLFDKPIKLILDRIVSSEMSHAWHRYIKFAILVVGISGGVRIHQLERFITAWGKDAEVLVLNNERWTLEIYRTIIGTLQSVAWMLLVVFVAALVAFVLLRGFEIAKGKSSGNK